MREGTRGQGGDEADEGDEGLLLRGALPQQPIVVPSRL